MIPLLEEKKDNNGYSELLKKIKEVKEEKDIHVEKNYNFNLDNFNDKGEIKKES